MCFKIELNNPPIFITNSNQANQIVISNPIIIKELDKGAKLQKAIQVLELMDYSRFFVLFLSSLGLSGNELFLECLRTGHQNLALILLKKGLLNLQYHEGRKLLIHACRYGSPEMIQAMLQKKIPLKRLGTPLLKVIMERKDGLEGSVVQHLVQAGFNLEERGKEKNTYFLQAVKNNDVELAALLAASGADIDAMDENGLTALAHVVDQDMLNQGMLQLLMSHHADIHKGDVNAGSALRRVCDKERPERIALLLNGSLERAEKYLKAMKERILLAHVNSIEGDFESNYSRDSGEFVIKALKSMPAELRLLPSDHTQLVTAFEQVFQRCDPARIVSSVQNRKLTFMLGGYKGHVTYLVFVNGYMAICNRTSDFSITAYKIDPQLFTRGISEQINAYAHKTEEEATEFFYGILPSLLSVQISPDQDAVCEKLKRLSPMKSKAGTCTYISAKTALRAAAAMMKINENQAEIPFKDLRKARLFAKNFSSHARFVAIDDFVGAGSDPEWDDALCRIGTRKALKHANYYLLGEEYQKTLKHIRF